MIEDEMTQKRYHILRIWLLISNFIASLYELHYNRTTALIKLTLTMQAAKALY